MTCPICHDSSGRPPHDVDTCNNSGHRGLHLQERQLWQSKHAPLRYCPCRPQ
ncbi:hypothetical protein RSAG8_10331, partial [Rhizoctonia solani AG-8 WAC10335]